MRKQYIFFPVIKPENPRFSIPELVKSIQYDNLGTTVKIKTGYVDDNLFVTLFYE